MRRLLVLASALLLSACGGDSSTTPTGASIAGTWNLTSVNGASLPFVVQAANPKVEVLSDVLTISAAGTFTQATSIRLTQGTSVTTQNATDAGTYTLNGTAASFRFTSDGSTGTATISGNTLIVADAGMSSTYTKQ